uniref:Uncharacterized protein n=1 Tax=Lepeophtheirus salmonis TaxID=72036 RepID=A0A0K2VDG8_LEPSM
MTQIILRRNTAIHFFFSLIIRGLVLFINVIIVIHIEAIQGCLGSLLQSRGLLQRSFSRSQIPTRGREDSGRVLSSSLIIIQIIYNTINRLCGYSCRCTIVRMHNPRAHNTPSEQILIFIIIFLFFEVKV